MPMGAALSLDCSQEISDPDPAVVCSSSPGYELPCTVADIHTPTLLGKLQDFLKHPSPTTGRLILILKGPWEPIATVPVS